MSWNDGYERNKFKKRIEEQEILYRKVGMDEQLIQEIYKYDLKTYCEERTYRRHTQPIIVPEEETDKGDDFNPLIKYYPDEMTFHEDFYSGDRFGWIENIKDETLYEAINSLSEDEKELLTLIYVEKNTLTEIAKDVYGISVKGVSKRKAKIHAKIIEYFFMKEGYSNGK